VAQVHFSKEPLLNFVKIVVLTHEFYSGAPLLKLKCLLHMSKGCGAKLFIF